MTQPRLCERTVGRIGISQLANHLRLGSCVRKHVDKVNHDNIKRQILNMVKFLKELLACGGVVELVVGVLLLAPESVELGLYQLALMNVGSSSSSSSTHGPGNIVAICKGIRPAKMAFRAYWVEVGRIVV